MLIDTRFRRFGFFWMLKRQKVRHASGMSRRNDGQTTLLVVLLCSFCNDGWLAKLALTCKAAFPATYALTARRRKSWDYENLLHNLQHNPTWTQHPARLGFVRSLTVEKHVVAPAFPEGLTGVRMLHMEPPCTPTTAFPPGVKTMFTRKVTFKQSNTLAHAWPATLEELYVAQAVTFKIGDQLPPNLRKLKLQKYSGEMPPGVLPASLVKLHVEVYGVGSNGSGVFPCGVLPAGLRSFSVGGNYVLAEGALLALPNLLKVWFRAGFDQQLAVGMLPRTLQFLRLSNYNKPLELGVLPESLKILHLGSAYNLRLEPYVLPAGLECLYLREGFMESHLEMSVESHVVPPLLRLLDVSNANQDVKTFLRSILYQLQHTRPNLRINFDRQPGHL